MSSAASLFRGHAGLLVIGTHRGKLDNRLTALAPEDHHDHFLGTDAAMPIHPVWADRAATDPDAVVLFPDPEARRAFNTARIIGISTSRQRLITIITPCHGNEHTVLTAFPSAGKDRRRYYERNPR